MQVPPGSQLAEAGCGPVHLAVVRGVVVARGCEAHTLSCIREPVASCTVNVASRVYESGAMSGYWCVQNGDRRSRCL